MIAVDWGTSSFRAYRLDEQGSIVEQRSAAAGLLACQGVFEDVLAQQLQGWDDPTILMAGMIGSRNGWHEVPYVACPAGRDEIAAGMREVSAARLPGQRILIAPGLSDRPASGLPGVMRGEETQVLGLLDQLQGRGPHTLCLPGTHSKWVTVEAGRITAFHTAMTGEVYAVLTKHSLLGALMTLDAADDEEAFALGLQTSRDSGGLLNHLFSARTRGLLGDLNAAQLPSYLSGMLIGHELEGLATTSKTVHLIGGPALVKRYVRALTLRGIATVSHGEALTAAGLVQLAQARQGS